MKKLFRLALTLCLTAGLFLQAGCGQDNSYKMQDDSNPLVTIEMDNGSKILVELYPDLAPETVNNFISLIDAGYYDGLVFHRIVPGFVIQGGDPLGNGTGGPGYSIRGEFNENGFENNLSHTRGVISMARSQAYDSAGSQFFICTDDALSLDGAYAGFGMVVSGMDEVDKIVEGPNSGYPSNSALEPRVMKTVTVETNGYEWSQPQKLAEQ